MAAINNASAFKHVHFVMKLQANFSLENIALIDFVCLFQVKLRGFVSIEHM